MPVFGVIANIAIGLVVILKSPRARPNQLLFLLTLCISCWFIFNFLADRQTAVTLLMNRAAFVWPIISLFTIYLFIRSVGGDPVQHEKPYWVMALLIGAICMTNLVVPDVTPRYASDGALDGFNPSRGVLYPAFVASLLLGVVMIMVRLRKNYLKARSSERVRQQLIILGIVLGLVTALTTNLFVPIITGNSAAAAYAPLTGLVFVAFMSYAIVKHKLFDVRIVIARSVAYVLALSTIALAYSVLIFSLSRYLFATSTASLEQNIFYLSMALMLAVTFPPLKKFFDRITDRIFFKNDYDIQRVLNVLGDTIVDQVDIKRLLNSTCQTFNDVLKPEFIIIKLIDDKLQGSHSYAFGDDRIGLREYIKLLEEWPEVVVQAESLGSDAGRLKRLMMHDDVALIVKLENSSRLSGFIFIGFKQNGEAYSHKDVQLLKVAASELSLAVQNVLRFTEIQDFNKTLQARIDEATSELRRNNRKLQALDAVKDEFISMASHQLRTPLTSIKGYLSMVLEGDAGELNPMQRKFLEEAYNSSQRMVFLIGDFLNVSRLNTGKFIIEKNRTNLAEMVAEEVEQLQPSAEARQLQLMYHKPARFPVQLLDENKLRQVVMNFMDNAIYYSRPGGTIRVELTHNADEIVLKVKDQGIGVPAAQRHRLFEKFYRASNAQQARPDGSGIGLFLAKKVIVAHKGSIIFESTEGKGSTFGFRIPLVPFDEAGAVPMTSPDAVKQKIPA